MGCTDGAPQWEQDAEEPLPSRLHIRLTYIKGRNDSRLWVAEADRDGSTEYDATGATPLDAMTALAEVLYEMIPE